MQKKCYSAAKYWKIEPGNYAVFLAPSSSFTCDISQVSEF